MLWALRFPTAVMAAFYSARQTICELYDSMRALGLTHQVNIMNAGKTILAAVALLVPILGWPYPGCAQEINYTANSKGIVLQPFYAWFANEAGDPIINDLTNSCAGKPDHYEDNLADVDQFASMGNDYGIIGIVTHGWLSPSTDQVELCTGEITDKKFRQSKLDVNELFGSGLLDFCDDPGGNPDLKYSYWAITPDFVYQYAPPPQAFPTFGNLPVSDERLIHVTACQGEDNPTMAEAFLEGGNGTFFGYTGFPTDTYATPVSSTLFGVLTNFNNTDDQRTTSMAYDQANTISATCEPGTTCSFVMDSESDQNLAIGGSIVNGGFEDVGDAAAGGHLTGWTKTFVPGAGPLNGEDCRQLNNPGAPVCSPAGDSTDVVATRAEHDGKTGSWSAQLGMWWNAPFYCDYIPGELGCHWVAGTEPVGDNQIYQDVQLGSGQQGGPTSFALTYSYKMKTYEGGGLEDGDFMYVMGKDLNTGQKFQVDTESPAAAESVSQGNASVTCCDNQAAVGCAVTSNRTILLRSWDRMIMTYSSRNVA
ncbi:MAG: hypothetical protein ACREQX_14935 [Candidatus Binataceae bacterium]